MRQFFALLTISSCLIFTTNIVLGQDPREAEIKKLENLERESVLKGDSAVLFDKIWSPKMIVNTPAKCGGNSRGNKKSPQIGRPKLSIF